MSNIHRLPGGGYDRDYVSFEPLDDEPDGPEVKPEVGVPLWLTNMLTEPEPNPYHRRKQQ